MRVAVIGGSGKIGSYLVPRLVGAGHEVVVVSRGRREPLRPDEAWDRAERVTIDRASAEADGTFGRAIADLGADAVVDLICFEPASARMLVEALRGKVGHLLHCGTHWIYGPATTVPMDEAEPPAPLCDYGRRKAEIQAYLMAEARERGFPATVVLSGHVVCPGDEPVNPVGNKDPAVFEKLARGEELAVPNLGNETLHHVHAADLAQGFARAIERREAAVGECFHVMAPHAVTLGGYARAAAGWFGREARLRFVPYDEWKAGVPEKYARQTWDHIAHSPCQSIEKARSRLGYAPRYESLEAVREAVDWLIGAGRIRVS